MALSRNQPPPEQASTTVRLTPALFFQLTSLFILLMVVSGADLAIRGLRRYPVQPPVWSVPGGEPTRGRIAIRQYGCGACHTISGIRDATGQLGPDLRGLRRRVYVAGIVPNTPEHLVNWIQEPQAMDPETAMPNLGVTKQHARDIAAYLLSE